MKIHIRTYGCQMNARDSEAVASLLRRSGHEVTGKERESEAVIVNTCSVRAKAEEKAVGKLRLLVADKRNGRLKLVVAMGCMVQRMGRSLMDAVPGLDLAVGPNRLSALPEMIRDAALRHGAVVDIGLTEENPGSLCGHEAGALSAFVTIMQGCSRRCAYCIVPSVRGPERSRPAADIMREIRELAAGGVKEVTLLGQSVTNYGAAGGAWGRETASAGGLTEPFPRLLEAAASVDGIERIRFTSGHPAGLTDQLSAVMSRSGKICRHAHLPLQSGSDRILGLMRRGYCSGGYRAAVDRLRASVDGVAITTDIIVGFPTESEADFEATRRLMDETGFDNAFIFKYSPRPGTEAAHLDDDVPLAEKARRNAILLEEQDARSLKRNTAMTGSVVDVMFAGPSLRNPARWSGRTGTNKIVLVESEACLKRGAFAAVAVESATSQALYGRLIAGPAGHRAAEDARGA